MGIKNSKIKVLPYDNESFYVGETTKKRLSKIPNGKGKFTDICGNVYIGEFANNQFNGHGTIHYNINEFLDDDGDILEEFSGEHLAYEGDWRNNVKHGRGELTFLDGTTYIGNFEFDEMHGMGKIFYQNGDYYIGEFKLGLQHGRGCLFNSNDEKLYDGQWINNCFHGKGTYYYTNGNVRYEGNWFQSLAHGLGILYNNDKSVKFYGLFENGTEKESYLYEKSKDNEKNKNEIDNVESNQTIIRRIETPFMNIKLDSINKTNSGKNTISKALKTPDMETLYPFNSKQDELIKESFSLGSPAIKENPVHKVLSNKNDEVKVINPTNILARPSAPPKRPPVKPIRIPSTTNSVSTETSTKTEEPTSYNYNPKRENTPPLHKQRKNTGPSPKHNVIKNPLLTATRNNFISNRNLFNKNTDDKTTFNPVQALSPTNKMFMDKRNNLISAMGIKNKENKKKSPNKFKLSNYLPTFHTQFDSKKNIHKVKSVNPLHDVMTQIENMPQVKLNKPNAKPQNEKLATLIT